MGRWGTYRWLRQALILLLLWAALPLAGCTALPIRGRQVLRAAGGYKAPAIPVATPAFEARLDTITCSTAYPGASARLLQDGDEAYPAMLALIESARERISLETYIVGKDETTDRFFQALRDAANRGVEVRLLVDAAGYHRGVIADLRDMTLPHLEARVFNPFFLSWTIFRGNNRDHRKILVVDGQHAIMGGINLSDEQTGNGITGWRDTALLVSGPAAADAEQIFAETWAQAGRGWLGKSFPIASLNPLKKVVDTPFIGIRDATVGSPVFTPPPYRPPEDEQVLFDEPYHTTTAAVRAIGSSPDKWASTTHDVTVAGILGARERIDAAYAYFVPPREVENALIAAAERGVRVRLLLPGVTDVRLVREIGMGYYGRLLEAGVEIYEWPRVILHAKTMAVDGKWLLVGSANMDSRSYFLNYEAVFAVTDEALAAVAHRQFEKDMEESTRLTLEAWRERGGTQRALETILVPAAGQF